MILKSIIILFSEMLEITIILAIIYASSKYLLKRNYYCLLGIIFGVALSLLFSFAFSHLTSFAERVFQDLITVCMLFLSIMLILVMMIKARFYFKYFKNNQQNIKMLENDEMTIALPIIIASSIIRECTEINFFFRAMVESTNNTSWIIGAIIGSILGILTGVLFYRLFVWLFNKQLLTITNWLLMFIAASNAENIPDLLASINLIEFSNQALWNSVHIVNEESLLGGVAKNIFGYKSNPTLVHFISYISVLIIGMLINLDIIKIKDKN
jgi:high-affinity iron transporter